MYKICANYKIATNRIPKDNNWIAYVIICNSFQNPLHNDNYQINLF